MIETRVRIVMGVPRDYTRTSDGSPGAMNDATGNGVKRSVIVTILDPNDKPIRRFHLENAWPAKWEGPTLKASGNEVAMETIELAHEGLSLVDDDR